MPNVPFIYQTARTEPTNENPSGQPIGQALAMYGEFGATGYIKAEDGDTGNQTVAVSTNQDYSIENVPAEYNGVATTYQWSKVDTTTATTLTNATSRTCNLAFNGTAGSSVLTCTITNAEFSDVDGSDEKAFSITITAE